MASWTKLPKLVSGVMQTIFGARKVAKNPFQHFKKTINVGSRKKSFFDLPKFGVEYDQLPFSIRVLLESAVRNCDNFQVTENDVQKILKWKTNQTIEGGVEVPFKPARVIYKILLVYQLW
uniref:Iron-responsive element-binding protein 2 n=1 Tax=Schizaphis graminum TaxID=13262 RepID=A0A2S2N8V2_SCHGA